MRQMTQTTPPLAPDMAPAGHLAQAGTPSEREESSGSFRRGRAEPGGPPAGSQHIVTNTACKVRLRFAKRGDVRLVSHHDLMRCLERALRRACIPMALSQGFNPRPKIGR